MNSLNLRFAKPGRVKFTILPIPMPSRSSFRVRRQRELDFSNALIEILQDAAVINGLVVLYAIVMLLSRRYIAPRHRIGRSDYFKTIYGTSSRNHFLSEFRIYREEFELLVSLISPYFQGRVFRQSFPIERNDGSFPHFEIIFQVLRCYANESIYWL